MPCLEHLHYGKEYRATGSFMYPTKEIEEGTCPMNLTKKAEKEQKERAIQNEGEWEEHDWDEDDWDEYPKKGRAMPESLKNGRRHAHRTTKRMQ